MSAVEPPADSADVELVVERVATGGHCVGRHPQTGQVVFVRHALPGERVRVRVTEDRGSYLRADAVAVLDAAPGRVTPPCPHAGPGRCGGCDWQHADAPTQRALKAAVVHEQFARLAGIDTTGLLAGVEDLGAGLLGWRTRIGYAVDPDGRPGLHRHRAEALEPIDACPLGVAGVGDSEVLHRRWPGLTGVEVVRGDGAEPTVCAHHAGPRRAGRGRRSPDRVEVVAGPSRVTRRVGARSFTTAAGVFWQVHPAAAEAITVAVLAAAAPAPGERVLELYCGAGMLTAALADAVGSGGQVLGVESDPSAVADARGNLRAWPWAQVRRARVDGGSVGALDVDPDVVVLDPPRAGAGPAAMRALAGLRPRVICYVSCDPATLARDVAVACGLGFSLRTLRAFDAFPMTHHVECVAALDAPDVQHLAPRHGLG